ncbi:MAG TPA: nodulation protein NfeD [Chitinophagaceae bacterium]
MERVWFFCLLLVLLPGRLPAQEVMQIKVEGSINPVTAGFIKRSIEEAHRREAECLLIHLNTPGGLVKSTRVIVSDILEAPVPVVVYVSPGGAHAGSAGVFITLAAHVAAMAPGTNIGAAHPVSMQGGTDSVMNTKTTNDAAAFIRAIAEKRNRNLEWAENAVRNSISVSEREALQQRVIDTIAPRTADLLNMIDGRTVEVSSGLVTLRTRGAKVETREMGWAERLLDIISDPNIAYILLMLGFYGLLFELYNPGAILPGIIGGIAIVLAFYAMHTLPINYAGLALIIFGLVLFLLEIKVVSHGMLAIGGVVALLLGSLMLIRPQSPFDAVRLSLSVVIPAVLVTTFFFLFVVGMGLRAQKARPVSGLEGMVGEEGESLGALNPIGTVLVHGEIWQARSIGRSIEKGEKVKVVALEGLSVAVEPI